MWTPEIQSHFYRNYQRIREQHQLLYGQLNFLTLDSNEPPWCPSIEKKYLLAALSAPEGSTNRNILNDQLKGILDQVTLMVRQMPQNHPMRKAALFVPNVREGYSSVIDFRDANPASVSLQVAGQEYLFKQNNGILLPKQDSTIAELPSSEELEGILPTDQDIIANQNLTGASLRESLPDFASKLETLFKNKRLYQNQESSKIPEINPISIITQMQDSRSTTLILNVKEGKLDSLFIRPTFDHENDNTFFTLVPKS
jgi:hypothetical protein